MIRFRTTDGARVAFITTDATGKTSWTWALDTGQPDWVDTLAGRETALLNLLETP